MRCLIFIHCIRLTLFLGRPNNEVLFAKISQLFACSLRSPIGELKGELNQTKIANFKVSDSLRSLDFKQIFVELCSTESVEIELNGTV